MLCGSILTLLVFTLVVSVQSLPLVISLLQEILQGLLDISVTGYRLILGTIAPTLIQRSLWRLFFSVLLSVALCAGITYLLTGRLVGWCFGLALLHGLAVGIGWERGFNEDHLHLGKGL